MTEMFDFTDDGRTYTCSIQERNGADGTTQWWWFGVKGDRYRYAPFRAEPDDTQLSVRQRVVSYYTAVMERRGLPPSVYPR